MDEKEYECMVWGHQYGEDIFCPTCGAYIGCFCEVCGAEVSNGYNMGTCTCDSPAWAEEALKEE